MIKKLERKQPVKVVVDSNALFVPTQFKIDIFADLGRLLNRNFELVLISPVKQELKILAQKSSTKMQKNAAFALDIAEKCTFVKLPERQNELVDETIIRVAKTWKVPVFTNDKLLRKKLRDISVPVIYVRQKLRLEIDGSIL